MDKFLILLEIATVKFVIFHIVRLLLLLKFKIADALDVTFTANALALIAAVLPSTFMVVANVLLVNSNTPNVLINSAIIILEKIKSVVAPNAINTALVCAKLAIRNTSYLMAVIVLF